MTSSRSAIADDPDVQAGLSHTREHMEFMTSLVGKYPFDVYGVLAADELFAYALETQTLSLHPGFLVDEGAGRPAVVAEPVLVHELAHQWFGDDVAPAEWSDVWLNEGHATWYEALYADRNIGVPGRGHPGPRRADRAPQRLRRPIPSSTRVRTPARRIAPANQPGRRRG